MAIRDVLESSSGRLAANLQRAVREHPYSILGQRDFLATRLSIAEAYLADRELGEAYSQVLRDIPVAAASELEREGEALPPAQTAVAMDRPERFIVRDVLDPAERCLLVGLGTLAGADTPDVFAGGSDFLFDFSAKAPAVTFASVVDRAPELAFSCAVSLLSDRAARFYEFAGRDDISQLVMSYCIVLDHLRQFAMDRRAAVEASAVAENFIDSIGHLQDYERLLDIKRGRATR